MKALRFRLGENDQGKYERGDEWMVFDIDGLLDMPGDELLAIEACLPLSIRQIQEGMSGESVAALLGTAYIGRYLAGVRESWGEFNPSPLRIKFELLNGDEPDPTGSADPSPTTTTT